MNKLKLLSCIMLCSTLGLGLGIGTSAKTSNARTLDDKVSQGKYSRNGSMLSFRTLMEVITISGLLYKIKQISDEKLDKSNKDLNEKIKSLNDKLCDNELKFDLELSNSKFDNAFLKKDNTDLKNSINELNNKIVVLENKLKASTVDNNIIKDFVSRFFSSDLGAKDSWDSRWHELEKDQEFVCKKFGEHFCLGVITSDLDNYDIESQLLIENLGKNFSLRSLYSTWQTNFDCALEILCKKKSQMFLDDKNNVVPDVKVRCFGDKIRRLCPTLYKTFESSSGNKFTVSCSLYAKIGSWNHLCSVVAIYAIGDIVDKNQPAPLASNNL